MSGPEAAGPEILLRALRDGEGHVPLAGVEVLFDDCEEIDLQLRLRRTGITSVALDSPTVVHTGGGSTPSHQRREWLTRSRMQYADKWGSRRPLQLALLGATAANLAVNSVRSLLGRDIHPLLTACEELRLISGRQ